MIIPIESPIELYQTGFDETDYLERQAIGRRISALFESSDNPMVVALNASWGQGKSFFLKRWVGAHVNENKGKALTVYIDAFECDFLDEPLVAISAALDARISPAQKSSENWKRLKAAGGKCIKPIVRISSALATAGLSELAGPVIDKGLEALNTEVSDGAGALFDREISRSYAMKEFQRSLENFIEDSRAKQEEATKIIIVVDELDRCRPDFALRVIETVKHFFSVPSVHFLLGINITELENSVRGRYGEGINARLYLQKFFTHELRLPIYVGRGDQRVGNAGDYLERKTSEMRIYGNLFQRVKFYLERVGRTREITLRDANRLITQTLLVEGGREGNPDNWTPAYIDLLAGLIVIKVLDPEAYSKAISKSLTWQDIQRVFDVSQESAKDENNHEEQVIEKIWSQCVAPYSEPADQEDKRLFAPYGRSYSKHMIPSMIADHLELIKLFEVSP